MKLNNKIGLKYGESYLVKKIVPSRLLHPPTEENVEFPEKKLVYGGIFYSPQAMTEVEEFLEKLETSKIIISHGGRASFDEKGNVRLSVQTIKCYDPGEEGYEPRRRVFWIK